VRFPIASGGQEWQAARMAFEFKTVRRVEFSETDMAGIVHFSNFFRYMEAAEHGFFRSLGCSFLMDQLEKASSWPRVHAECEFRHPLRFEDEVEIHLLVIKKKSKAISCLFKFTKINGPKRTEVARGTLTAVCVVKDADGNFKATRVPKQLAARIEVAPARLLK
jgi:YbgC/YbaW family acyl-CoA thioester hydrolase